MASLILVAKFWREGLIAVLLALCVALTIHGNHEQDKARACAQARVADQATWKAATAQAQAGDLAHARDVEAHNAQASTEAQNDLTSKLVAARAAAADYAARLRAASAAHSGGGDKSGVPQAGNPAAAAAGAGQAPVMDGDGDEVACAEAVVKAEGWQTWWRSTQ